MIKNIIASGCSFTSNGIGGLPPSALHPEGGCSYTFDDSYIPAEPRSWASIIAQLAQVKSFVNLSAESHGNILIANNILTLLQRFNYNPNETLIFFNMSDPGRLDILCEWVDPLQCPHLKDWSCDILPFKYLDMNSSIVKNTIKTMGVDQVELLTSNMLLGMMSFLKQNNFNFYFLMMKDYSCHPYLGPVVSKFSDHLIKLSPGVGMYEFSKANNLLAADNFHPSLAGYKMIADVVINKINLEIL